MAKTKPDLRRALARLMEMAKNNSDFSNTEYERQRWEKVLDLVDEALENPSVADIQRHLSVEPK